MGSMEEDYSAYGVNRIYNFWAAGTGRVGFFTTGAAEASWGVGGSFRGWYHGVYGAGGAAGPNGQAGPPANAHSGYCGVVGTGYYVNGVAGTSTYGSGVYGQTEDQSTLPWGVTAGVIGTGDLQPGVIAWSREGDGVRSVTYTGNGVFAASYYGQAVHGQSGTERGVTGISGAGTSVPNTIDSVAGVMGTSGEHPGVVGTSTNAAGVAGYSKGGIGVYGETGPTGSYAGLFRGNVHITGNLTFGPLLMAAVPFPDGTRRALYCMESPELCFEDFGSAKLRRGRAIVRLDANFAKVVKRDDYRVFPVPEGDCRGLYVRRKSAASFEVRELNGGKSNVAFSYRIVGKRRDIKKLRRFAKVDMSLPVPARTRHKLPSQAGFRAFVSRFEKEARRRAPKGAKKMRERPSTIPSRDDLMRLMQKPPEHSEAKGRRAHEYDHHYG